MPTLRRFGGWRVMSLPSTTIVPGGRLLEAGDHPQGRRLAAAGRAEERDELAALGGEVEVLDGGERRRSASGRRSARGRSSVPHGAMRARCVIARPPTWTRVREPRPRKAITPIASQVRPKLMSETAAGVYGWLAPEQREVRPERGCPAEELRDRVLADDDRERQEGAGQERRPQVREDHPPQDPGPARAQALGGLRQRSGRRSTARPVSTARYMYGNDRTTYAATRSTSLPDVRRGQLERPARVRPDEAEDEDDRRDHERHERHELDDRAQPRHLEPDPVGRRHDDQRG